MTLLTAFFSSVKNNWFAESIVNAHNFAWKALGNMLLIFFFITGSIVRSKIESQQ